MVKVFRKFAFTSYGAVRSLRNGAAVVLLGTGAAVAEPVTIAALGDSLTAGYGLMPEQGFVPQLERWLRDHGADVTVLNAGVSGDTTAGGLARTDWTLTPDVDALIVTLGGNDMLRGLPPATARSNLDAILTKAEAADLPVLLAGIPAPENYGPDYKAEFDAIYPELAAAHDALLFPNFLAGLDALSLSEASALLQADGLHPNDEGVKRIVDAIGPSVLELVERVQ